VGEGVAPIVTVGFCVLVGVLVNPVVAVGNVGVPALAVGCTV
jgi:hypothetical protein